MATYIPSITLPAQVFATPAISILLPVALGSGVGFTVRRTYSTRTYSCILYTVLTLICFPAAKEGQDSYLSLKLPAHRPPPQAFSVIWPVLYGLMGYSAHRAWTTGMASLDPRKVELTRHGATLYTIQLGLNLIWMPLFFQLKRPVEATVDILALTGTVGYLTYIWGQVDEVAGWCLAPYLGWLGFASYLTVSIGHLNEWNLKDKETDEKPSEKSSKTLYVDEAPEEK